MNTSATEFAFVLVTSILIAQAFAVGCLWLFVEFIRAPEHIDDWYEDEDTEPVLYEVDVFGNRIERIIDRMHGVDD